MNKLFSAVAAAAVLALTGAAAAQSQTPQTAQPAAPAAYTDAQLQAFAAASLEIDPISRSLAGATPEAQAQAATQIRAILERHQLDSATYNGIAAAAQADAALAQRIAALQVGAQTGATAQSPSAPGGSSDGAHH